MLFRFTTVEKKNHLSIQLKSVFGLWQTTYYLVFNEL